MSEEPTDYAPEYLAALRLFNQGQYFESHEALEELWVRLPKGPEKAFYQAVIHIAAAFLHRGRGRPKPALAQYRRARDKFLSLNAPEYHGLDLRWLIAELDPCFLPLAQDTPIEACPPAPRLSLRHWAG